MPPLLKFLRLPGSCCEKDLEVIDKSIHFAQSNQIDVVTISDTEEVKTLIAKSTTVDQSIYVCMPFEGKIFEKLKEKGYRIIGPQCVISCLLLEIPVPKRTYPVYNVSMLDTVVCCSSMKKEERMNIQQLVLMMGGDVTGDFTLAVTQLVAKEVGSKKYEVACSNDIPTVFPSWIHSSWEKSKYDHFVATENSIIKEHLIPIFKGCTICVTGIDATKRDAIKTIVTKNGGVYSGELNMKTCTHLIVEHPHGQKYIHARQWKLHCVSPTWLYDCLKKKRWISEKQYIIEPATDTTVSTTLQQSSIQNTILGANSSRLSSIYSESMKNKEKTDTKNKDSKLKFKVISPQSIKISNVKFGVSNSYLEECQIYICHQRGPIFDICKKIINNGGGIRLNVLSESITHVVLWDEIKPDVNKFLNGIKENDGVFPHVLSPSWLVDCCKNGRMMLEDDYSLVEHPIDKPVDDGVFVKPNVPVTKPTAQSTLQMQFEDDVHDVADESTLLNQYLTVNHESTRISQLDINEEKKGKPNLDEVTQEGDSTVTIELDDESNSILEKKKFAIHRCEAGQVLQISHLIDEYGGEVMDNDQECDYIIVPVSHNEDVPFNPKEVTLCWLEQSIELQKLQDPQSSFLFQPFHLPDDARPLQNCVITISQYTGIERQHLFHLAELLGGSGQEYFVRNDTATMKASTHLILSKPEGSKYDASVKWNIPCVGKEWLFRCAEAKRRLPEDDFSMSAIKERGNGDPPMVMTIEETNAHAWDKKADIPKANEKSIIAAPPDDITDNISIDFSSCGATLMGNLLEKDITEIAKPHAAANSSPEVGEDIATPFVPEVMDKGDETSQDQTTINCASPEHPSDEHEKSLHSDKETDADVQNPSNSSNDFSAFNAFIANEKRESLDDKENECGCPMFPSSLPGDFNKSRFSFDFSDALDGFPSPLNLSQGSRRTSTSRRSRVSLPLDIQFTEALQKAVDKHCGPEDQVFNDVNDDSTKTTRKRGHSKVKMGSSSGSSSTDDQKGKQTKRLAEPLSPKEMDEVQKKMEEIMNAAKVPRAERRTRRQTTNNTSGVKSKSDNNCHRKMRNRSSSQKNESVQSSGSDPQVEKMSCVDLANEQSQGGFITYDDPTGRLERERILEHLKRASPSQDIESYYYPVEKLTSVKDTKVEPPKKKKKKPT